MEMEMEVRDDLLVTVERLAAAAGMLEQAAERLTGRESEFEARIEGVIATSSERRHEAELEKRLADAEATIAELRASTLAAGEPGRPLTAGRKTLPVGVSSLLAKQGVMVDSLEAGALDAALVSLSVEQRFAVKAQLMRAGLV